MYNYLVKIIIKGEKWLLLRVHYHFRWAIVSYIKFTNKSRHGSESFWKCQSSLKTLSDDVDEGALDRLLRDARV